MGAGGGGECVLAWGSLAPALSLHPPKRLSSKGKTHF